MRGTTPNPDSDESGEQEQNEQARNEQAQAGADEQNGPGSSNLSADAAAAEPMAHEAIADEAIAEEPTIVQDGTPHEAVSNGALDGHARMGAGAVPVISGVASWPGSARPTRPLTPAQQRALLASSRLNRRRKRYASYIRRTSRTRAARQTSFWVKFSWATAIVIAMLILTVVGGVFGTAASYYSSENTLINGLNRSISAQDSVRIYDRNGVLLYQFSSNGAQHSVSLSQIPITVVNATVAVEDHDFWNNNGVDFTSIVRAAQADLSSGQVAQGGSTITQQLIKSQLLHDSQVKFGRKIEEATLAVGITETGAYSKRQILEMYLNSIPYSPTAYGIDEAAQYYFGYKDQPGQTAAQQLDLAQSAMLAGIPQNPSLNDPLLHPKHALFRQSQVLSDMVKYGYITQAQADAAHSESIQPHFYHPTYSTQNLAPHFVEYVREQLLQMVNNGQVDLSHAGLNVYTTLDMNLQNHAQEAMKEHLYGNDTTDFKIPTYIRNDNVTNSAALIADQHTGGIVVYLGSIDYNNSKIDGAFDVLQAHRQPGSSFKPFVYATAMEKGWFPAMTLADTPTNFYQGAGLPPYQPLDYDTTQSAETVTIRTALDWSLNIPAVKTMQYAGVSDVERQVRRMGITSIQGTWGLAAVLGSLNVTPFQMVQAYTVFANYGRYIPLYAIDHVTDSQGNVLYQHQVPTNPVTVMDPRIAFLITSILSDNASRDGDFGDCSPLYLDPYFGYGHYHYNIGGAGATYTPECLAIPGSRDLSHRAWPTAAKTGTNQNFLDDWTMGYTMDYTGGIWVGNDNYTPMVNIDGISAAAPIWYSSMLYAEESQNLPRRGFPVPQGVHLAKYCVKTVCTTDWFLNGVTTPNNIGEFTSSIPCVSIKPNGGFSAGPPCEVGLKTDNRYQNAGAEPPVIQNGIEVVGVPQ